MMEDDRTRDQLLEEIDRLRQRIASLEGGGHQAGDVPESGGAKDDYYRFATEHANDGIVIMRGDEILYFNRKYMELLGYDDPEALASLPAFTGVHPDDLERVRGLAHRRQQGEKINRQYECRVLRRDRRVIHVEISSSLILYRGESASLGYVRDITERKQASEALIESERRYRDFIDFLPLPVCEFDPEGRIALANRCGYETFGYDRGDLDGEMSVMQLVAPEERFKVMENIRRLMDGERLGGTDYTLIRKDGTRFPAIIFSSVVWKENRITGFQTIMIDDTERRRAEEALRASEERFRLMTENVRDTIWMMDMDLHYTYMSPYVEQILGYTPEEYIAKPLQDIMTPASLDLAMKVFAEELEMEKREVKDLDRSRTIEVEHIGKDGRIVCVDIKMTFIRDAAGLAIGILGISRDITDRKLAENALRASEEKYRTLTNNIPDLLYVVDGRGRIMTASEDILNRYGYLGRDVVGRSFREFVHPEDVDRVVGIFRQAVRERREFVRGLQFRLMAQDGTPYWFELNNRTVFDGQGCCLKGEGVLRDITARKDAEMDRAILEERLQRAEKMEALGTLAGGVAHDLNNVLGVVVGYAEMLLAETDASIPFREHAVNIMQGGERATAIVQDLLTLARRGVKTGKVVNLNTIVMDYQMAPEFYKLRSLYPKVQVTTDLEGGLPNIVGSPVHLTKTVMNLFTNAMEAMPEGGLLTVHTSNRYLDQPIQGYEHVREGNYVVLSVTDTGFGISAADMKRIFEPFYTKKVMGRSGTGLGLSVVWGTIKDHSGYIDVQSGVDEGTTMTLYFPVTDQAVSESDAPVSVSEFMGAGESVLVVDDEEGQRNLAVRMLSKLNYRATSVASGEEAVAYLLGNQADLVVLDMIMAPGMDGMETYRRILAIHPHQKAIVVSAFAEMGRIEEIRALGVGAFVRKPYVMEKLGVAVRSELDRSP